MRRVQQYIVGFYEQPSEAMTVFDSLDARRPPDEKRGDVWRTFIEARSAHSPEVTASAARDIREASGQKKISRDTEVMMLAALGATGEAFDAVNLALDRGEQMQAWFLFTPVTRNMRQNPRFLDVASRLGLIKYWRETGKWPDFCTDAANRGECSPQLLAAIKSH
jgi:hypothetical protein